MEEYPPNTSNIKYRGIRNYFEAFFFLLLVERGSRKRMRGKVHKQFVAAVTPRRSPEYEPAGVRA